MRYSTQYAARSDVAQTLNSVLLTMQFWPEHERNIGIMTLDAVAAGHGVDVHEMTQAPQPVVIDSETW